jgi:hypothetical protein
MNTRLKRFLAITILFALTATILYSLFIYNHTAYSVTIPNKFNADYIKIYVFGSGSSSDFIYVNGQEYTYNGYDTIGQTVSLDVFYYNIISTDIGNYGNNISPAKQPAMTSDIFELTFSVGRTQPHE